MSKHTPGPWMVALDSDTDAVIGIWDEKASEICFFEGDRRFGPFDEATHTANARLIAAAPDLLASTTELLNHVKELCTVLNIPLPVDSINRAEAAIAKAKGEA